jgi:PASTA domain
LTGREAALPAQARGGTLASVSCASAGNCTAVGRYVDHAGNHQGLLLTEAAGRWARGVKAALPSNASATSAFLDSVSCVSAGDCTAVGTYDSQGLLLTKTAGFWATGVEAALPANGASAEGHVLDISCASAGNCAAVGAYGTFPPDRYGCLGSCNYQGLLLTETAGVWSKGVEAALPADAAPASEQLAYVTSVSCPSPGNCSAVGSYVDGSGNYHGLLLTETAGNWATGVAESLPANATDQAGKGAGPNSVSCPSARNCTAVGSYSDGPGSYQGLLLSETAGTWAKGVEVALPSNASTTSQDASVGLVSCASPGNCTAVGSYLTGSGTYQSQGLLLTETAGVWSKGAEAALPANALATGQTVYLNSLSCPSAGNCSVAGEYVDSSGGGEGLLLTQAAGRWAAGVAPALPAGLHNVRFTSVSCSSVGNCSALGAAFDSRGRFVGLLFDSTSTRPCVVPRLKGKTLNAAKRSIRSHDCSLGRIEHARSPEIKQGRVISQTPKPGIHLRRKANVDLVVSKGKQP